MSARLTRNPVTPKRKPRGKPFEKGNKVNLTGERKDGQPKRRQGWAADVRELCRLEGEASIRTIIKLRDDPEAPHAIRLGAAIHLLDRGYGRAPQTLDVNTNATITVDASASALEIIESRIAGIRARLGPPPLTLKSN
jgi:hypothetical protein